MFGTKPQELQGLGLGRKLLGKDKKPANERIVEARERLMDLKQEKEYRQLKKQLQKEERQHRKAVVSDLPIVGKKLKKYF